MNEQAILNMLLVDDHELFREGLKLLLSDLCDGIAFAEAADCASALDRVARQRHEIILLDLALPGTCGMEALRAIRDAAPESTLVVLSGLDDPKTIRQAIEEGAAGFIPKNSKHAVMTAALRLILAGGIYLPPHAMNLAATPAVPAQAFGAMSCRQMEALRLAMQGKPNKVIARDMEVSEATVKAHLAACFRALGVRNRTEAVFAASRAGLPIGT